MILSAAPSLPLQVRNMMKMNILTGGRLGYNSLLALLIALEADMYVLTTASNWSRLINELRLNVVEPSLSWRRQQQQPGRIGGREGGAQCGLSRGHDGGGHRTFMLDLRQSRGRRGDD